MSHYSTGELAKVVGVSVRTVQYYDQRGLLIPSEVSDGGRRIYNNEDLQKLQVICFLRDLEFSIEQIKKVLSEENADAVLELLLENHVKELKEQVAEQKTKLDKAVNLLDRVKKDKDYSLATLKDISITMKNQNSWRRLQLKLFGSLLALLIVTIILAMLLDGTSYEWLALVFLPIYLVILVWITSRYHRNVEYLCPNCHKTFSPRLKEFGIAAHTPRTRKLTCPHCHEKSYCLELAKER